MNYKVRNKQNKDGTYTLSYGRGKKKLTAMVMKKPDGWWYAGMRGPASGPFGTMKECKGEWGRRAARAYGGAKGQKQEAKRETVERAEDSHAIDQAKIDNAPDRRTAWAIYRDAEARNDVCRSFGGSPEPFTPPPGPPTVPARGYEDDA